jgi:hypothetical protein
LLRAAKLIINNLAVNRGSRGSLQREHTMGKLRETLIIAAVLVSPGAAAQDVWPSRPLKLVVPVAAGGGIDLWPASSPTA